MNQDQNTWNTNQANLDYGRWNELANYGQRGAMSSADLASNTNNNLANLASNRGDVIGNAGMQAYNNSKGFGTDLAKMYYGMK